jgi:hypothetical protein
MKKIILFSLVCMALLLPAVNTTSNAAAYAKMKTVAGVINEWVLSATSGTEDGPIKAIEVYRLSTGELVRKMETNGQVYDASIDLKGLPSGGYSARIICTYVTVTKQFKL